jgi:carbonic anhydrase
VLGCSDSRVPPELVFDALLGELFVIRVAGNVLSPEVAGSIQYASLVLKTPLFVVLGHEGCGAVKAALASRLEDVEHRPWIQLLVDSITPAVADVDEALPPKERLACAVESNVRFTMRQIRRAAEDQARAGASGYRLLGAVYELSTGRVRFLEGA